MALKEFGYRVWSLAIAESMTSVPPHDLEAGNQNARVRNISMKPCLGETQHTALPILPLGPDQCIQFVHLITERPHVPHDDGGDEGLVTSPSCLCKSSETNLLYRGLVQRLGILINKVI